MNRYERIIRRLRQPIDVRRAFARIARRTEFLIIVVGVGLRLFNYVQNRPYWLDEQSLASSLVGCPILSFAAPLANTQLVSPGFLAVERVVSTILGDSRPAMRLYPLVCGIASIFWFREVASRCLSARAALIALTLFTFSSDLIYYSTELKQYSGDVAIGLVCTSAALVASERLSASRAAFLLATAALAPWFSHPSAFMIAGLGATLAVGKLLEKRWKEATFVAAAGAVAGLSFLGSYVLSMMLLDSRPKMWAFWDFAFLRLPPRSRSDLSILGFQLSEALVNPLDMIFSLMPVISAMFVSIMIGAGVVVLAGRKPATLAMIVLPILLTAFASGARRYPFHGRLLLFLVPSIDLLVAAGADALGRRTGRTFLARTLVVLVLAQPILSAANLQFSPPVRSFNRYGDFHEAVFSAPDEKPKELIHPK